MKYKAIIDKNTFYSHIRDWKDNYQVITRSNWFIIIWITSKMYLFSHPNAKVYIKNERELLSNFAKDIMSISKEYFTDDPVPIERILRVAQKYGYVININNKWHWVEN